MVLPLFKVLSVFIRVFSRPLINYTKQVHLKKGSENSHPLLRKGFVRLGNNYYLMQTWVNRKFMKIQSQFAFKQLNDQLAIQKGIQFFYQVVFYCIVIGLPVYEMWQSSLQSKQKSKVLEANLKNIDERLAQVMKIEQQQQTRYYMKFQKLKQLQQQAQKNKMQQKKAKLLQKIEGLQTLKVMTANKTNKDIKICYIPKFKYHSKLSKIQQSQSKNSQTQTVMLLPQANPQKQNSSQPFTNPYPQSNQKANNIL